MRTSGTRTRAVRRIAADPTSTALLLAGPSAFELWPGARSVQERPGHVVVDADPAPVEVRAFPPKRTPTSYVTRFTCSGPGVPTVDGELVLAYVPGGAVPTTHAALVLVSQGIEGSAFDERRLQAVAQAFLDNLAVAAEARSTAA